MITKAGSNSFHGSGNYFFQNANLQAENENSPSQDFSTFDTAFTAGGPVVRTSAWVFGSYRYLHREDDVTALDTLQLLRNVDNNQKQGYFKGTVRPPATISFSFTFLNDPTDITGRIERDITNARDRVPQAGWQPLFGRTTRVCSGPALFEAAYNRHNGELSDFSTIRESAIRSCSGARIRARSTDEQRGGWGSDIIDTRDVDGARGALSGSWDATR